MSDLRTPTLFDRFAALDHSTSRVRFAGVVGGEGISVLLLHGHRIALSGMRCSG